MEENKISKQTDADKAKRHEENLKRLKKLRPIDDMFLRALLKENIPLAQMILRIIMQKDDLKVIHCTSQADFKRVTGARSICLDAYATDDTGKKYDIEVQRADSCADVHRARYHASMMDVENLDERQDFGDLPDTYIIFITENDYFGENQPLYHAERVITTLNKPLNDGNHIIYVNGQYRGHDPIGKLMHDFFCNNAYDMHYDLLANETKYLKENKKGVDTMCEVMEELKLEGKIEGKIEGKKETAYEMFKDKEPIEKIAKYSKVDLETAKTWIKEFSKTVKKSCI